MSDEPAVIGQWSRVDMRAGFDRVLRVLCPACLRYSFLRLRRWSTGGRFMCRCGGEATFAPKHRKG